jgi:hypothetical protein
MMTLALLRHGSLKVAQDWSRPGALVRWKLVYVRSIRQCCETVATERNVISNTKLLRREVEVAEDTVCTLSQFEGSGTGASSGQSQTPSLIPRMCSGECLPPELSTDYDTWSVAGELCEPQLDGVQAGEGASGEGLRRMIWGSVFETFEDALQELADMDLGVFGTPGSKVKEHA